MLTLKAPQKTNKESRFGIIAVGCGVLSILGPALVFVPLTFVISIVAIFNRQMFWGFIGLFLASIGFITSPILIGIAGFGWLWANFELLDFFNPTFNFFEKGKDI